MPQQFKKQPSANWHQRADGSWWYYSGRSIHKNHLRSHFHRGIIQQCENCHSDFPVRTAHRQRTFCDQSCYRQFYKYPPPKSDPKLSTGKLRWDGYRVLRRNGKEIPVHRLVMEQILGRKLLPTEQIHHINGIKSDNRPENLELWHKSQPAGIRVHDKKTRKHCPTCHCSGEL